MEEVMETGPAGESGNSALHTLIPLEDFKALLSVDDREDCLDFASVQNPGHEFLHGKNSTNSFQPPSLAAFCLITATFTIERYCKRRLLKKRHTDYTDFWGDYLFPLREYPVRHIEAVHWDEKRQFGAGSLLAPETYRRIPEADGLEDTIYCLSINPAAGLGRGEKAVKVRYEAGYETGEVPADLASACLELAAWNMTRYRGRRIGLTGAVRGKGQDGEHLEPSMPENVRQLLEPYRRRVI
jgi:hypothetical protein